MGQNPEVVAFLLAFENDRLLQENDSLKLRIKDLENNNQDGKVKELQQKLDDALRENSNLKAENERLQQRIK